MELKAPHQSMTLSLSIFSQCWTLKVALLSRQVSNDTWSLGQTWEDSEQHFHQVRWLSFEEGPGGDAQSAGPWRTMTAGR